jgi:ATP-dependent Clp protease ATP-binding subunit ClpA
VTLEQFSAGGRDVVQSASDHAISLGHNYIGTEHLLLGVMAHEPSQQYQPLTERNLTRESMTTEIVTRLDGFTSDADALRTLGIDPERLLEQARTQLGVDLQIQGLTEHARRLPANVRPEEVPADAIPFTPRAFKVLNLAVGVAAGELAEPRHILQALLEEDGGLAVIVLDHLGVDLAALHSELATSS